MGLKSHLLSSPGNHCLLRIKVTLSFDGPDRRIQAPQLTHARLIGLDIGQEAMGWDIEEEFDAQASGWAAKVHSTIPHIDEDEMVLLRRLEKKFELLEGRPGIDVQDRKDILRSQREDWGEGTGGNEVASDAEEHGLLGPSEWQRHKGNKG